MLVFLCFFTIILFLNLILYFSSLKIEIETLKIDTSKKINDFKIKIFLTLLGKIKFLKITIDKNTIKKLKINKKIFNSKRFQKIREKGIRKNSKSIFDAIKKANINIERLYLKADIGMENIIILSYLVALLDILIGIIIASKYKNIDNKKYSYVITPCKTNKVYLNLSINCIISIKIANIINRLLKKRGNKDEGTSYRIADGNCYEQYTRYG